jgi:hypothetical protein
MTHMPTPQIFVIEIKLDTPFWNPIQIFMSQSIG